MTLVDVVEHVEEAVARDVRRQAETVARRQVVLTTPCGYFRQEGHDAFGLGGEDFQQHKFAWNIDDLTALTAASSSSSSTMAGTSRS